VLLGRHRTGAQFISKNDKRPTRHPRLPLQTPHREINPENPFRVRRASNFSTRSRNASRKEHRTLKTALAHRPSSIPPRGINIPRNGVIP
jgi:hypothetical protein